MPRNIKEKLDFIKLTSHLETILKKSNAEGFPTDPIVAFILATDVIDKPYKNQIIMSRVPGGATTGLIRDGYDTKGFLIKTKSCDWGPMAGFVCKLPPLNKKGYDEMEKNYERTKSFWDKCQNRKKGLKNKLKNANPFKQISLNENRIELLKNNFSKPQSFFNVHTLVSDDVKNIHWGVTSNKKNIVDSTVAIEFLLIKEKNAYCLYHGNILIRENRNKAWLDYQDYFNRALKPEYMQDVEIYGYKISKNKLNDAFLGKIIEQKNGLFPESRNEFYKLEGICNLDGLGSMNDKSTVTGDYDLFVIWPVFSKSYQDIIRSSGQLQEMEKCLTRLSEKNYCKKIAEKNEVARIQAVFSSFFYYDKSLPVVIQFIPHFDEIENLENPELGNYNDIGDECLKKINNDVKSKDSNIKFKRVHHSDEGGRPGINLLDLPVLASVPNAYINEGFLKNGPFDKDEIEFGFFLIDTPGKFLSFCSELQRNYTKDLEKCINEPILKCPLILNHAWLLNLIACSMTNVDLHTIGNTMFHGNTKLLEKFDEFCNEVKKQKALDLINNTTITVKDLKTTFFPILPYNNTQIKKFFTNLIEILIKYTFDTSKSAITVKQEFDDLFFNTTVIRL